MKTYRAKFNPNAKNVYGVSLVHDPAMEGQFVQFSKQEEIKFADVDKSKRRVMGLILEPNKLIYRNQNGEQFNIMFTEQDIEEVAYNFQKQSSQTTSTIEHSNKNIEGVTFVETWLVENSEIDKSANFGFNYPKGSWMGVMQLDNDDVWNDYVVNGKVRGFSIDAFMQLEEVNLKLGNMDNENKILEAMKQLQEKIVELLTGKKPSEDEAAAAEMENEIAMAKKSLEETKLKLAENKKLQEEEKEISLKKIETEKEAAIKLALDEAEKAHLAVVNLAVEEANKASQAKLELAVSEAKKPLEDKNLELTKEVEKLKAENLELSKKPATKTIGKGGVKLDLAKDYASMTNREKMEFNRNK